MFPRADFSPRNQMKVGGIALSSLDRLASHSQDGDAGHADQWVGREVVRVEIRG